ENAAPAAAVRGDVTTVHHPDVGLQVVRLAGAIGRRADVEGERGEAAVIGDDTRLDIEPLQLHTGERQGHLGWTRREDVNPRAVGELETPEWVSARAERPASLEGTPVRPAREVPG